jgi:DNA-binding NtrC family response regulator
MNPKKVLIVDDESALVQLLGRTLRKDGYEVSDADTAAKALEMTQSSAPDLVLLDLNLPDSNGLVVLSRILRAHPATQIVMMTGQGDIETAVQAMKLGARDFLTKPFGSSQLKSSLQSLWRQSAEYGAMSRIPVGDSPEIKEVWAQISRYALPDVSILLSGESGTGKELFARVIHAQSKRSSRQFVALDCATLPETLVESELFGHERGAFTGATEQRTGKFELSHGGTIFLDEIGNLPINFQAKLLRVVQERYIERLGGQKSIAVDVRIVSATNLSLEKAIERGVFREDLYHRLAQVMIHIPPLRERRGDIEKLTHYFIELFNARFGRSIQGISDSALNLICEYRWPGNVRELENVICASLLAADDVINVESLPDRLRRADTGKGAESTTAYFKELAEQQVTLGLKNGVLDLKAFVSGFEEQVEQAVLRELLRRCKFTQLELCALLKVDPKTLRAKLTKYELRDLPGSSELPPEK